MSVEKFYTSLSIRQTEFHNYLIYIIKLIWHITCLIMDQKLFFKPVFHSQGVNAVRNYFFRISISLLMLISASYANALAIDPFYSGSYSATSLGSVTNLPPLYGGLTFLNDNTVLIGGAANGSTGQIYQASVTRDINGHVTGFGAATAYGTMGTFNDGGVVIGPGGVLFTAQWPVNKLGQTKPGSTVEDKVIDTAALGIASSLSAFNFVPTGFGGAGHLKLVSYSGGQWYDAQLAADGNGTFDLVAISQVILASGTNVPGGPEGFVYIGAGNPLFSSNSLLLSAYGNGTVDSYQVDGNGDPILSTRKTFVSGLGGAEGAAIDPVTGDFLFSTFGGGNQVVRVTGFNDPTPPTAGVPEPAMLALFGIGLLGFGLRRRRK
jgi:PEP-CTERM motif